MSEILYVDLLIENGDFVLNSGNEPTLCNNDQSIAQDIVHSIIESGLATALVKERSPTMRGDIFTQMELLVESDERIIPGSVVINEESEGRLWVTASTYDFGNVSVAVD